MNKHTLLLPLLIACCLVRCHSKPPVIPKAGEIWRVTKPFVGDITIDSINQEKNYCFHKNDTAQERGICAPQYFEGYKHGGLKPVIEGPITEKESQ